MSYDDDNDMSKLIALMSADVERRVVREVLEHLDEAERTALKKAVLARVNDYLPRMADAEVDKIARGWVEPVAREAATKKWATVKRKIEDMVDARIEQATSEPSMKALLDTLVPSALNHFVQARLADLLLYAKERARASVPR